MCINLSRLALAAVALLLPVLPAMAQTTRVDQSTQVSARGNIDFSAAATTKPAKSGAVLPVSCSPSELFYLVSPAGQNLYGCTAQSAWAPLAASTPLTMAAQVGDLQVTKNGNLLAIGAGCTPATPCNTRFGHVVYRLTNPATAEITAGTGSGIARIFVTESGVVVVDHSTSAGLTVSCSGCGSQQSANPTVPPEAIHLADVTITAGAWNTITDQRAFLSSKTLRAGSGIVLADVAGETEVAIDAGDVPRLGQANAWTGENDFSAGSRFRIRTGTTPPAAGECATSADAGQLYARDNAAARSASFFLCSNVAAGVYQWEQLWSGVTTGAYLRQTLGTLAFHPIERTAVSLQEEFFSTTGRLGQLAWQSTGTVDPNPAADADHPGTLRVTTAAAADSAASLRLGGASQPTASGLASRAGWEALFVFQLGDLTGDQYQYRVGLVNSQTNPPEQGVYARLLRSSGCASGNGADTAWQIESRTPTNATVTNTSVTAASSDWVAFRVRSTTPGTILAAVARNGEAFSAEQTLTTNLPAGPLFPSLQVWACDGTARSLQADSFAFFQGGLAR